jgi:hypothetical protein
MWAVALHCLVIRSTTSCQLQQRVKEKQEARNGMHQGNCDVKMFWKFYHSISKNECIWNAMHQAYNECKKNEKKDIARILIIK